MAGQAFFLNDGAELRALPIGCAFTTTRVCVGGCVAEESVQHPPNWATAYSADDLARFMIARFEAPEPPPGATGTQLTPRLAGGRVVVDVEFEGVD